MWNFGIWNQKWRRKDFSWQKRQAYRDCDNHLWSPRTCPWKSSFFCPLVSREISQLIPIRLRKSFEHVLGIGVKYGITHCTMSYLGMKLFHKKFFNKYLGPRYSFFMFLCFHEIFHKLHCEYLLGRALSAWSKVQKEF